MYIKAKLFLPVAIILGLLLATSVSFAATYSVNVNGLPNPSGIEGFSFWYDVDETFTFDAVEIGDAVPTSGTLGWETDNNKIVVDPNSGNHLYKFGAYDQDGLFLDTPHYLTNGTLFSFSYEGDILGLSLIELTNDAGTNQYPFPVELVISDSSGINLRCVPIPSAVLLLGTGLMGLIGLRRRNR